MDKDELIGFDGQIDMFLKNGGFIARILVEPNLADAQHAGLLEKLGNHGDDFAGKGDILGFFGIDAEPAIVLDAKLGRPLGLDFDKLPKIIAKSLDAAPIEAGPKSRLAHGDATALRHALIIVGHAGDHVNMRVDVFWHRCQICRTRKSGLIEWANHSVNHSMIPRFGAATITRATCLYQLFAQANALRESFGCWRRSSA